MGLKESLTKSLPFSGIAFDTERAIVISNSASFQC